jgi:hypothetical protein
MKNKAYKAIRSEFETNINSWTACKTADKEMQSFYAADRKALNNVLKLMDTNKFREAWRSACKLETNARNRVPQSVWKFLLEQNSSLLN